MKNLTENLHKNYLNLVGIILNRLPPDSTDNMWAQSLKKMLLTKTNLAQKHVIFSMLHQTNRILIEFIKQLCRGRFTVKQLAQMQKISEEEVVKQQKCDINMFFSPLAHTVLLTTEELLQNVDTIEVSKGKQKLYLSNFSS